MKGGNGGKIGEEKDEVAKLFFIDVKTDRWRRKMKCF